MTKSHSTAAVSGRQGSGTAVSRSGTAENFGKPLSKLLHGESVISSPPRNDMISVLIPVPVGPSPFDRLAISPRTIPLMSGISIWITRTPCSRRRSEITRARDPRASSRPDSITLLACPAIQADREVDHKHDPSGVPDSSTRPQRGGARSGAGGAGGRGPGGGGDPDQVGAGELDVRGDVPLGRVGIAALDRVQDLAVMKLRGTEDVLGHL